MSPRYGKGDRYCSRCRKVLHEGDRCPDCNMKLRCAPKDSTLRLRLGITAKYARVRVV